MSAPGSCALAGGVGFWAVARRAKANAMLMQQRRILRVGSRLIIRGSFPRMSSAIHLPAIKDAVYGIQLGG
jgi:hypothetical protein